MTDPRYYNGHPELGGLLGQSMLLYGLIACQGILWLEGVLAWEAKTAALVLIGQYMVGSLLLAIFYWRQEYLKIEVYLTIINNMCVCAMST